MMSRSGAVARARALLGDGSSDAVASTTQDVTIQTDEVEPWVLAAPDGAELRDVCQALVAENEDLRSQVEELTQRLTRVEPIATIAIPVPLEPESEDLRSQVAELTQRLTRMEPISTTATPAPLELGYVVLRTPDRLSHLRGHHRATWDELLRRLKLTPQSSRAGFHIRLYTTPEAAQDLWQRQRLAPPMPLDPQ